VKILIHGNGPHVSTGYGVQVALLAERLKADGHDVAISCTYGQQGGLATWRGLTLYPAGYETNGNDILHMHALHHFEGDPLGGWIITLLDVWCLHNPVFEDFNIAAWTPVDHFPVPPAVLRFFDRSKAIPVAMSSYGEDELLKSGLDPAYVPLAVDTNVMRPTATVNVDGEDVPARSYFEVPDDVFVVGMVAMNKGWARDRKGFNEAFRGFAAFHREHPDSVLFVHAEKHGAAEGIDLPELALHAGLPKDALVFSDQYAYRLGQPAPVMAAMYTMFDVLLAPSHGEGFCVPLVEAQACGTPVIASDFTSQSELVGVGVRLGGQAEWDPAQHASYLCPSIGEVTEALRAAYDLRGDAGLSAAAVRFAGRYDADRVYDEHWRPFLATLEPGPSIDIEREPIAADGSNVAVVVPLMREENLDRLMRSLNLWSPGVEKVVIPGPTTTYAQKVNAALGETSKPWLFIAADDVEFHPDWVQAAAKLSDRFDVIGTNDTAGPVKNPAVANGSHADHFFIRRSYIDEVGASLDGPGILAPEAYKHWFVDREIIGLAKARGVFAPCLESVVEHHHPAYDGREDLRAADPTYMLAVESSVADKRTWMQRVPLIEQQRTSRSKRR
jgi:glycosyltransferase involved in cell wall biosynthesis